MTRSSRLPREPTERLRPAIIDRRVGAGDEQDDMTTKLRTAKAFFRMLGPGLVTGAADDDPSGIATYSQAGAQFGYALSWTMFLTTPFMIAIQMVSARVGAVTGRGLAANLNKALPASALFGIVGLLLIANTLNLAADIAAMGDALRLVIGGPGLVYVVAFGLASLAADILIPYRLYARYLKALTLALFAMWSPPSRAHTVGTVLAAMFLPHLAWDRDFMLMLVAIFGTTISPYMFFWQASLEAEERKLRSRTKDGTAAIAKRLNDRQARRIGLDTAAGMLLSNIIGFFIIVTTAATLHAHGKTDIAIAAQAAEVLRPLAGPLTFVLFSLGIIGTGLLAAPVLAGSAAYAVAESFHWNSSLELPARRAPGFYLIVAATTIAGFLVALTPLDPIHMLFWAAVVNGVVAVPLMVFGWLATALMAMVVAAIAATGFSG